MQKRLVISGNLMSQTVGAANQPLLSCFVFLNDGEIPHILRFLQLLSKITTYKQSPIIELLASAGFSFSELSSSCMLPSHGIFWTLAEPNAFSNAKTTLLTEVRGVSIKPPSISVIVPLTKLMLPNSFQLRMTDRKFQSHPFEKSLPVRFVPNIWMSSTWPVPLSASKFDTPEAPRAVGALPCNQPWLSG